MQTDGHLCRRTIAVPGLPALLAQGRPAELGGGQRLRAAPPPLPQGNINKPRTVQPAPLSHFSYQLQEACPICSLKLLDDTLNQRLKLRMELLPQVQRAMSPLLW